MIVSAHDGYPRWVNSGADYIEIDIRRTPDGVIVLSHDEITLGQRAPTLDDVLDAARGKIGIQLDLKEQGYEVEVVRKALGKHSPDRVAVTSPFMESVRKVKEAFPEVKAGLTRQFVERANADFIALDRRYANEDALAFGVPLWIWTVDEPVQMWRLTRDKRVDGIITNRPRLALLLRKARS